MRTIQLNGNSIHVYGTLPAVNTPLPSFVLTQFDLSGFSSSKLKNKPFLLNIFPSLDTSVCAVSVRRFNDVAKACAVKVFCVSADLPFAQKRFCEENSADQVVFLSSFRTPDFGRDLGVQIIDSALAGLLSRVVILVDGNGIVRYTEQVPEISQEPDYDAAILAMKSL